MFKKGQSVYVQTSTDYEKCVIIRGSGSYYIVNNGKSSFGASSHRILTEERYNELVNIDKKPDKPKYVITPPPLH